MAGYGGAISSGCTTCGFLIGTTIAIGLRVGRDKEHTPQEDLKNRAFAIMDVNDLYDDFIGEFGSTTCNILTGCDLSKEDDFKRFFEEEIPEKRCAKFMMFIMKRLVEEKK